MLIVSRRDVNSIEIRPGDYIDPEMTLADLFRNGPIEITVISLGGKRAKMGVQAPSRLSIWRKSSQAT